MNKTTLPKSCKTKLQDNEVILIQNVYNYRRKTLQEKIEFINRSEHDHGKKGQMFSTVLSDTVFVKNEIIGVLVAIKNGDSFAIGISRCNRNLDRFSPSIGIDIAVEKARDILAWKKAYNYHKTVNVPFTMGEEYASFKERCMAYFNGDPSNQQITSFIGDIQLSYPINGQLEFK